MMVFGWKEIIVSVMSHCQLVNNIKNFDIFILNTIVVDKLQIILNGIWQLFAIIAHIIQQDKTNSRSFFYPDNMLYIWINAAIGNRIIC